jgi:iron complex outermembrane receptor protein
MSSLHHPIARRLVILGLCLGTVRLFAQTAAAQPDPNVVELSPFQVTSKEDRGYTVSESMTGSRVKTQIIDLPYTVNVLTSEFLSDFGLFELADNVTHISGFTGLDVGGNFLLRGFVSSNQLRDGFFRLGRYGSSNVDRIEIIKGSSAAIYGRSSPGGMMNMISKRPKPTASQSLSYNYGDYGTKRLTYEATGPLFTSRLGKTSYLLTASDYQRDFDVDYALLRNKEYYLAVDHEFKNGSKLFLAVEDFSQIRNSPPAPAPVIIDQKGTVDQTDDRASGYATNLNKFSSYGPLSRLNRGNTSFTVTYEKTINPVFSAKFSANRYMARRDDYNSNQAWSAININRSTGAAPTSQRGGGTSIPQWGRITEDGGAFQADLLAHYWTNNKKIEHRTLLTFDYNLYHRWDPTIQYGAATHPDIVAWNAVRTVTLDANLNPVAPLVYFTKEHDPVNGYVSTRKMKRHTTATGGLLRHQSALLDGKLLLYTGARFDSVKFSHRDYLTAASSFTSFIPGYVPGNLIEKTVTELKPNFGTNYKIRENFRVFANYSESYFIAQGDNPVEIANPSYKSEIANGWDYGFKGSLLDNRITYTVSGFYIIRENVSVADIDELTGLSVQRRDGNQLVRGFEVDATWNLSDQLSLLGSYGDVHSIYTDFGTFNPQAIGRKVQYVAPYNGSLSLKFTPKGGLLRGFSANIGVTFVGETPTEDPIAGDTHLTPTSTVISRSTEQWKLTAPAYSIWSVGLRYRLPSKSNLSHTVALNINNVADEQYFKPGSGGANRILTGDARSFFVTYTLGHKGTLF